MVIASQRVIFLPKKLFLGSAFLSDINFTKCFRGKLNPCNLKIAFMLPIRFKQIFNFKYWLYVLVFSINTCDSFIQLKIQDK